MSHFTVSQQVGDRCDGDGDGDRCDGDGDRLVIGVALFGFPNIVPCEGELSLNANNPLTKSCRNTNIDQSELR